MAQHLKIALWNANGLTQHSQEVKTFITLQNIDIMLITETHYTEKSYIKIPNYAIYNTRHPDGTAHGGTAIIIRNSIKHYEKEKFGKEHLQATSIVVIDTSRPLTISAVYCPPKHILKKNHFEEFFNTLGHRFIAGGDYNAKHLHWGSRLVTSRGRELFKVMESNNLQQLSTGEPTYWPTDRRKIPDVIDFCVTKGIARNYLEAKSCLDLSSDHSPVIISLKTEIQRKQIPPNLTNKHTDWNNFKELIEENLNMNISIKTADELDEAIEYFNKTIQQAAWKSTPPLEKQDIAPKIPMEVKQKIAEKRKLRRLWKNTRTPDTKTQLNRAIKELKALLHEFNNNSIQMYLAELTPTDATEYSLWRATKRIKRPQVHIPPIKKEDNEWARSDAEKAQVFANHLEKVFSPFPTKSPEGKEDYIYKFLESPLQMDLPIKSLTLQEIKAEIKHNLSSKKAPGYDLLTGKIIKELPEKGKKMLLFIFNGVLRTGHFPSQWKLAQIVLIPKPGKNPEDASSYRPISLLPMLSKLFEKALLRRVKPILKEKGLIPDHQFGFRHQHATTEQIHRVANKIERDLHANRYCSAVFLDISQAFDKVWHTGLLYKLKLNLPHNIYLLLKSYLTNRYFQVKFHEELTTLFPINSGVPQGSVLGPILYLIYTADLPRTRRSTIATYADDTAIMSSHKTPDMASLNLQKSLHKIQNWLQSWRIKVNETKCVHITFTNKRKTCPPVTLNGREIPQAKEIKYLGMHLDRRLTWRKHIQAKRKQLGIKFQKFYWLIGRRSSLTTENKIMLYKAIIKPIWTYGIQLWGAASLSNIAIIERFQGKALRCILNAPWYVPNWVIAQDLQMATVREEITRLSGTYHQRLAKHPNKLAARLLTARLSKRLKRAKLLDLPHRFET